MPNPETMVHGSRRPRIPCPTDNAIRGDLTGGWTVEMLGAAGSLDLALAARSDAGSAELRGVLCVAKGAVSLSNIVPILHSLGAEVFDERPRPVVRADGSSMWVYEFGLAAAGCACRTDDLDRESVTAQPNSLANRLCDCVAATCAGAADVDSFNALVSRVGLTWSQSALLRAYANYLQQVGFPDGTERIATVLAAHPRCCAALIDLFTAQFDPDRALNVHPVTIARRIAAMVPQRAGHSGRILSAYLDLIQATVRTNYYRAADPGPRSSALALKLDPRNLTQLPQPRPRFEVFVFSPRVEGVHLRYGTVARGGLRWSERRDDYRTEILGLAKVQAVKNAVVVPDGAKGGFVVKHAPAPIGESLVDRDARRVEAIACYRAFVAALLDVTDRFDAASGTVTAPTAVVRRDGDDPYLVVAADKGTATFSDEANAVAAEYGFWLGDAFASGGSVGYDHKAMGITAKGAWESVRRHFRELGIDTQSADFTVAGIGDMSGDVFGNGMLLSKHIRLVAAFDHRHIFLDPHPDPVTSYRERRRLFALPRSSWNDYDRSRISAGGGVFERTATAVPVSTEMREVLGLSPTVHRMSGQDLVRAILCAPVDLLWNGGIGTYVKAAGETHLEAGDKANDDVRVDAGQIRATVIGEGGNLGVTDRGRIEFARGGGRINTDALDNCAGVDCSDHEVNIKILLDGLLSTRRIDLGTRNLLLEKMSGEVERLVLTENVDQNALLGTSRATAAASISVHARQIRELETRHGLDRRLVALPDDDELDRRKERGQGLSSPELATLTAHVKLAIKADLLVSNLVDGDTFADRLLAYFPEPLRQNYPDAILTHRLRRDIIATVLTNEVVDRAGIDFLFRLCEDTGTSTVEAVRAYAAASAMMGLPRLLQHIRLTAPTTDVSDAMTAEARRLLDHLTRRMLEHRAQPIAIPAVMHYGNRFGSARKVPGGMPASSRSRAAARGRPAQDASTPPHPPTGRIPSTVGRTCGPARPRLRDPRRGSWSYKPPARCRPPPTRFPHATSRRFSTPRARRNARATAQGARRGE